MPLEIRGAHFLIRSAQLVRGTRLEWALIKIPGRQLAPSFWSVGLWASPMSDGSQSTEARRLLESFVSIQ